VIEREHGVGLAAPEVRLQFHDRIAATIRKRLAAPISSELKTFGQIGTG
jgi:hypothetical protein